MSGYAGTRPPGPCDAAGPARRLTSPWLFAHAQGSKGRNLARQQLYCDCPHVVPPNDIVVVTPTHIHNMRLHIPCHFECCYSSFECYRSRGIVFHPCISSLPNYKVLVWKLGLSWQVHQYPCRTVEHSIVSHCRLAPVDPCIQQAKVDDVACKR